MEEHIMEMKKYKIEELIPATYNPRKNLTPEDNEYQKIKRSIEEFGYVEPIIINKDKTIIGGHQRLNVLRDLGYKEIDVIEIDIDKTKEKALNVALNKITGEWDMDKLGSLLNELNDEQFDLKLTGFDASELDGILFNVDDLDDTFELKDGDRQPIQTMSITFSDNQAELVNQAIDEMKKTETYKNFQDEFNENSNGNALYLVVLEWTQLRK